MELPITYIISSPKINFDFFFKATEIVEHTATDISLQAFNFLGRVYNGLSHLWMSAKQQLLKLISSFGELIFCDTIVCLQSKKNLIDVFFELKGIKVVEDLQICNINCTSE